MSSFIKTIIAGFVGANPVVKMVNHTKKATISVAVNYQVAGEAEGEKVQKTEWHTVEFWGSKATKVEELIKKGDKIEIEGKSMANAYLDKDGKPQVYAYINAFKFEKVEKEQPVAA